MKRKLLAKVITFGLVFGLLPQVGLKAQAAGWTDSGAYSTAWFSGEEPYAIATPADLAGLAALVNSGESFEGKSIELTADIDLSARNWVPIGTGENAKKQFKGSLDGDGHTISGMRISGYYICAGLFGSFGTGTIEKLILDDNCSVSCGGTSIGAIVGSCKDGTISKCESSAAVDCSSDGGNLYVGGLVGLFDGKGKLEDCTSRARVTASGTASKSVGGLVGLNVGEVARCKSLGEVTAKGNASCNNAGGLFGFDNGGTTKNSYNRGNVSASGAAENNAGGLAGRFSSTYGILQNCYCTGKPAATGGETSEGGIIGKKLVGTVYYCYYKKSGDLTGIGGMEDKDGFAVGMTGKQMTALPSDAYGAWSSLVVNGLRIGGSALVTALNKGVEETPDIWAHIDGENGGYPVIATNNWADSSGKYYFADFSWMSDSKNNGSEEHPYLISTAAELAGLAALVNSKPGNRLEGVDPAGGENFSAAYAESFEGKHIKLAADIELAERLWTPIGSIAHPFLGSFDGDGYAISGMYIGTERAPEHFAFSGLFGVSGGSIENVTISADSAIYLYGGDSSSLCVGGVLGMNTCLVSGCQSFCKITVFEGENVLAGGVTGSSYGQEARVRRCCFEGSISADLDRNGGQDSAIGGIVGLNGRETKQDAYFFKELDGETARNIVHSCVNSGKLEVVLRGISARAAVGGIVGENVLIRSAETYTSTIFDSALGRESGQDTDCIDFSAAVSNCANLGKVSMTIRGSGAQGAVGGVVGGNIFGYSQSDIAGFFTYGNTAIPHNPPQVIQNELFKVSLIGGTAQVSSCFNAGVVSASLISGAKLYKGGVIGLSSAEGETDNCFYNSDSAAGISGIGSGESDESGAVTALGQYQMKARADDAALDNWAAICSGTDAGTKMPMVKALNDWGKANDKELAAWGADGTAWPYLSNRLSYDAKGGENAPADNRIYSVGDSARVCLSQYPTKPDCIFLGWALMPDAAKADFPVPDKSATKAERAELIERSVVEKLEGDTVLYALWESKPPKSKDTEVKSTQNDDGSTTQEQTTTTVAANGDVTTETTRTTKDSNGKTLCTETVSSFFDSALGTTTERIKTKPASGSTVRTACFIIESTSKAGNLPEELSKELRAGTLESVTLTDKENSTSTVLGWETDENGNKTGQSASISADVGSEVRLSAALMSEIKGEGFTNLEVKADGVTLKLPTELLKAFGDTPPRLSMTKENGKVSILANGKVLNLGESAAKATVDYKPMDESAVAVIEFIAADGKKSCVPAKLTDGKLCFSLSDGVSNYEIVELEFPFDDVKSSDWFDADLRSVYASGLMTGVSERKFAPAQTASRGMVVTLLWRMAGQPQAEPSGFSDVPADTWYAKAVGWAAQQGIVSGISETSFAPDAAVSREQLVTILYRWKKYTGDAEELPGLSKYSDGTSVSDYAREAMRWACAEKIITGRSDGSLDPAGKTARSELAAIMVRILGI